MQHRAYLMRLKKEHTLDYVEIHRKENIWSAILDGLQRAKIAKQIIVRNGTDLILFEEAEDLRAAYSSHNTSAATARWDALMDRWIENYPKFNAVKGDVEVTELPVVFYYENGKLLH